MTVGSQVKGCYSSIKSIEASLGILSNKTQNVESKQAFEHTEQLMKQIKNDLQKQVVMLSKQEPQYK
ncbi:DUF1657 domain-containing protein [Oceanobacillus rekensis]|uniref:DUF1657 domain-containing protein n=1 Tax=Oceanobacillus rekensis TaxID=937927 RepID=UPI000B43625C|nr:DUF1657 domain-containing protein [Oceanobacillus rekensis]